MNIKISLAQAIRLLLLATNRIDELEELSDKLANDLAVAQHHLSKKKYLLEEDNF